MDPREAPILYVDDELANLQAMHYLLDDRFQLLTASSGEEALKLLGDREIAVLIADMKMPSMSGADVCARAREIRPHTVRMILTAQADVHAAIDAINRGQISKYIAKPFQPDELVETLRSAMELWAVQRSLREMELRLLRGGAPPALRSLHREVAQEIEDAAAIIGGGIGQIGDLLVAAVRSSGDAARLAELLESARLSVEDVNQAVASLQRAAVSLREKGQPSRPHVSCDAAKAIDGTVRLLRPEIGRRGRLELRIEALPLVPMEATALGQVLMNLLLNAAAAAKPEQPDEHHVVVTVTTEGAEARISVADNGIGVAAEDLERIVDPYVSRRGGAGLGLAIARDLVVSAGGRLELKSEPGLGTTATIRLPLVST